VCQVQGVMLGLMCRCEIAVICWEALQGEGCNRLRRGAAASTLKDI
jgi:hypothetical protein